MAHITKLANGKWKAEIVIRQGGKRFRKSFTDARKGTVKAWADEWEPKLRAPGGVERAQERKRLGGVTVGSLVTRYLEDENTGMGSSKRDYLCRIRDQFEIGNADPAEIKSDDIVDFARYLVKERGVEPSTAAGYVGTLCELLRLAAPAYRVPIDLVEIDAGRAAATRLGLCGKSNKREVRPTIAQINSLMDHMSFEMLNDHRIVPMPFIIAFAIFSGRREAEIVRITWSDIDEGLVYVRDMKHPKGSAGNHKRLWMSPEALRIAEAHLKFTGGNRAGRVFPYHKDVLGRRFTNAVTHLGLGDLHFHDLRHEACSRLGELGFTHHQIMRMSGHTTSATVDRYVQLEAGGNKFEDWSWLEELENMPPRKKKTRK